MAFQSHVLEDGQWVTRTSNVDDILSSKAATAKPDDTHRKPPQCGIMTRTVVPSPVANWILPVRLRSSQHNDVAFVGDHYVQISELRRDGQLHAIIRKCDFGSRIRNAKVIGSSRVMVNGEEYATTEPVDDDSNSDSDTFLHTPLSPGSSSLPPQLLLIALETGDCVFLFLRRGDGGSFEFVAHHHRFIGSGMVSPGFHLAVDPSSRFVAQANARNMFVIYRLESMHVLNDCYARRQPLKPILSCRTRAVNGVIHSIEFLFPRPQDPQHIILLLIVVSKGVSRIVTYDWELGDDLEPVLAEEKNGHVLPPQHEMPLMIIPLTVRSAFFAVSEDQIAYCADVLHGSPSFKPCEVKNPPSSKHHDGTGSPLWTAWSRPPRLYPYHRDKDFIYLAREDGVVIYLECDSDDILVASFYHGTFCNVSTAFASLADEFDDGDGLKNGENLVFGGDTGQGGVWRASPRKVLTQLCRIPNWSPTVDFVTTAGSTRWDKIGGATGSSSRAQGHEDISDSSALSKPDKIYAVAGRASNGSIVEFRHGLQANIGIEFNFDAVIKRCFMFQENSLDQASGYHFLLSVPGRTALLYFDSNFSSTSVSDVEQEETPYDLFSPTLIATPVYDGITLQVTEQNIIFVTPSKSARFSLAQLGLGDAVVTDATLEGNALVIASHTDGGFQLHTIKLDVLNLHATYLYSEPFTEGEVTSFGLCRFRNKLYAVACLWWDKTVYLDFYCLTDRERVKTISLQDLTGTATTTEPFTSIVLASEDSTMETLLVAGSRDGLLVTVTLPTIDSIQTGSMSLERISSMPVHVYPAQQPGSVFVCSDSSFVLASKFRAGRGFTQKHSVWTVDAEDSSKLPPAITSVTVLPKSLSGNEANMPLLLLATDQVMLAELQPQVGPVQRQIPLGMTPLKLLYSHVLKCLVVAAKTHKDKATLRFIDPDTGEDLSLPVDNKTKEPVRYIDGLGRQGERILCLEEWHMRSTSGQVHYHILVTTSGSNVSGGRVLIVAPKVESPGPGQRRGKIRVSTRYKLRKAQDTSTDEDEPREVPCAISAVAAFDHKIQSSTGTQILYHEFDESERKMTQVTSKEINGQVWKLSILPGGKRTLALVKGDALRAIEDRSGLGPSITHVERTTRFPLDMLEVAGSWEESMPKVSEPSESIVLVSDQTCGLRGVWIPWDSPGKDCEVVFEADLPSIVRRLRLGRTLPSWSKQTRRLKKFGVLAASIDEAEILGMGIDGSLQHFTLLDMNAWRFLRFVQNISETSADLYPFTYHPLEARNSVTSDNFEPLFEAPELETQVDGDLMQRCLDTRALEGLLGQRSEWVEMFVEYLDRVDDGRWTKGFQVDENEEDATMDVDERKRRYIELAYEILEYLLVPVI